MNFVPARVQICVRPELSMCSNVATSIRSWDPQLLTSMNLDCRSLSQGSGRKNRRIVKAIEYVSRPTQTVTKVSSSVWCPIPIAMDICLDPVRNCFKYGGFDRSCIIHSEPSGLESRNIPLLGIKIHSARLCMHLEGRTFPGLSQRRLWAVSGGDKTLHDQKHLKLK
jgi:hypothetical protein